MTSDTEETSLLKSDRQRKHSKDVKQNYKSFKFAESYHANPKTHFTKYHFFVCLCVIAMSVAWIATSLVIGLPLVKEKMIKQHEAFPDANDQV